MDAAAIREALSGPWRHGEHHDLTGIVVREPLDLSGLCCAGVDFSGARFMKGFDASNTRFQGLSWFRETMFDVHMNAQNAYFLNDARFERATFNAPALFDGVELHGIGRFDGAHFARGGSFKTMTSYGNVSLDGVRAGAPLAFTDSEWLGGLWCQDAHLPAETDFSGTQIHGRLWLRGAVRGNAPLMADQFPLAYGYVDR